MYGDYHRSQTQLYVIEVQGHAFEVQYHPVPISTKLINAPLLNQI